MRKTFRQTAGNKILILIIFLFCSNVFAKHGIRIYVFPPKNFIIDKKIIFKKGAFVKQKLLDSVYNYAVLMLRKKKFLSVFTSKELDEYLSSQKNFREGFILGREWMNLGESHYESLKIDKAIEYAKKAEKIFLSLYFDAVNPETVGNVNLLQGVSYVEKGLSGYSHIAFKKMLFMNPWIRFKKGYYPEVTEKEIESSVVDFIYTFGKDNPLLKEHRLLEFMKKFSFDYILYFYSIRQNGKDFLTIVVIPSKNPEKRRIVTIPFENNNEKNLFLFDSEISRWLGCENFSKINEQNQNSQIRYGFVITSLHSTYLKTPSRSLFYNIGYGFGIFYRFVRSVSIFLNSELYTSIIDKYRDLTQNFNTIRMILGLGFNFGTKRIQGFIFPGFEIHHFGDFTITTDPYCKFFGTNSEVCNKNSIFEIPQKILAGINLKTGAKFFVTKNIFLEFDASMSTYFLPLNQSGELNFFVSAGFGMGYSF